MRILVAPDKFKGAQTAREAAVNIAAGIHDVFPEAVLELLPVADGGEGTAEVICDSLGGEWHGVRAQDAAGNPVVARYVWLPERATAVMEMSEVAGVRRLSGGKFDIENATTFGVGEMMIEAMAQGAREILVGLGGSVTNDGGFGMARAQGYRFIGQNGRELKGPFTELRTLARIETKDVVGRVPVVAATDVRNPLLGLNGATRVFGPQKGATPEQLQILEEAMEKLAAVAMRDLGVDNQEKAGAGAAGGLGFGLVTFWGATIRPGFEVVSEAIGLEERMRNADVVVTGEGSLDRQTLEGKAPVALARMARRLGKRVVAVVGRTDGDERLRDLFDAIYVVSDPARSDAENIRGAGPLLREGGRKLAAALR